MKKTIFILAIATIVAGTLITSCELTNKKAEKAPDKMQNTLNDDELQLEEGRLTGDSISEYQKFKIESEEKILAFENTIADFKIKIENGKKETKAEYEKKLASLEQKNNELKKKLEDYKEDGKDNWAQFKSVFNQDMDELSKSFNELTKKI
ncbi:MAG: hypothetical protein KQI35_17340 [Bacteroidetes bacterium]|nr:hypothetical protein [Bacteroidota bacterium]